MNETHSPIWAKSSKKNNNSINLAEHIKDVLDAFDGIKDKVKEKDSRLHDLIRLAIVCHDWGKVLPAFQIRTLKNTGYKPPYPYYNLPHSFFSLLWIDSEKLRQKISEWQLSDVDDYASFVISAVAYHHWRESFFELLNPQNQELGELCEELESKGYIEQLKKNLLNEIKQLHGDWHTLIGFNTKMAEGLRNGVSFSEYARPPYQLYWLPKRIEIEDRKLRDWILISGFLMRSDHFASFCEEEGKKYSPEHQGVNPAVLKENIKKKIGQTDENRIWQFQKIKQLKDENIILVAPTGYGKTEFAFLWSNGEKFFYTLPLRAAVNQIFDRARSIFKDSSSEDEKVGLDSSSEDEKVGLDSSSEDEKVGLDSSSEDEKVGLLHSDADVYLLGDGGEAQANLRSYDLARQLAHPVLISTGDQFFPYALRPPGYEKIYATFSYSRLVIDEVQAYDPRAAAIIVKFIEDIVRMGGKFLLMTATLPKFVETEINQVLKGIGLKTVNLYEEQKSHFEELKKHSLKVQLIENTTGDGRANFKVPDDKLQEVLNKAKEGKRVLVMANTVKQAQDIFDRLQELVDKGGDCASLKSKLWLLHSRFTPADRSELEAKLVEEFKNPKPNNENEGKILVATQVVEASLDIDADVLFTEIAPLDALVQRMGRVWRRYGPLKKPEEIPEPENPNVYVWVFKHGLHSGQHHVYDNDLVLLTLKLLKDKSENVLREDYKDWLVNLKAEDRIEAGLKEVFGSLENQPEKARGRKRDKSKDVNLVATSGLQGFQLTLSEYDKFALVEKLYDLPDDHSYLTKFRQTKDILDAGYMSDRLEDAQQLFREISTVSVIPEERKDCFIKEVQEFFINKGKGLYTHFKRDVLAKFIVQVNLEQVAEEIFEVKKGRRVEEWLNKVEVSGRCYRWCRDLYIVKGDYDSKTGLHLERGGEG